MNKKLNLNVLGALISGLVLTACNGGSSGSSDPVPPATYSVSFVTSNNIKTNSTFTTTISVTTDSINAPSSVQVELTDVSSDKTKITCNSPVSVTPNSTATVTCTTPDVSDSNSIGSHQMQASVVNGSAVDMHTIFVTASGTVSHTVDTPNPTVGSDFIVTLKTADGAYGNYTMISNDGIFESGQARQICNLGNGVTECDLRLTVSSQPKSGEVKIGKMNLGYSNFVGTESISISIPVTIQ